MRRSTRSVLAAIGTILFARTCIGSDDSPVAGALGACCICVGLGEIACFDATNQALCELAGGEYLGDGTTCEGTLCEASVGACCLPDTLLCPTDVDGASILVSQEECLTLGGEFLGACRTCTQDLILEPCFPFGACCLGEDCEILEPFVCEAVGGIWQGEASECFGASCTLGACCLDDACIELNDQTCLAIGGNFLGVASTCADASISCTPRSARSRGIVTVASVSGLDLPFPQVGPLDRVARLRLVARPSLMQQLLGVTNLEPTPIQVLIDRDGGLSGRLELDGASLVELFEVGPDTLDLGEVAPFESRVYSILPVLPWTGMASTTTSHLEIRSARDRGSVPATFLDQIVVMSSSGKNEFDANTLVFVDFELIADLVRVNDESVAVWAGTDGSLDDAGRWLDAFAPGPDGSAWFGLAGSPVHEVTVNGATTIRDIVVLDAHTRLASMSPSTLALTRTDQPALDVRSSAEAAASLWLDGIAVDATTISLTSTGAFSASMHVGAATPATLSASEGATIADEGNARVVVGPGSRVTARDLTLGAAPGSSGELIIEGDGDTEPDVDVPFFVIASRGEIDVRTGGVLRVGLQVFGGIFLFQEASLVGQGTVEGNVLNFGVLDPGGNDPPGAVFTIDGVYEQLGTIDGLGAGSGTLRIDAAGVDKVPAPTADRLVVTDDVTIGGGLVVTSDGPFDPGGEALSLTVLEAPFVHGSFDVAFLPAVVPSAITGQRYMQLLVDEGEADGAVMLELAPLTTLLDVEGQSSLGVDDVPVALTLADLVDDPMTPDDDGAVDLAVVTDGPDGGTVYVFRNDGTGEAFVAGPLQQIAVGPGPVDLLAAQLDGDMLTDLAVLDRDERTVRTLLGDGATFAAGPTYAFGPAADPVAFVEADLDDDGAADLIVADEAQSQIALLGGNGDASFFIYGPPILLPPASRPRRPDPADLDNRKRGIDAIVFAMEGRDSVGLIRRGPLNTYTTLEERSVADVPLETLVVDLDNDGALDVAVISEGDPIDAAMPELGRDPVVSVLLGSGDGALAAPVGLPLEGTPTSFVAGLLDDDADVDFAVLTDLEGQERIEILRNDLTDAMALVFSPGEIVDVQGATLLDAGMLDDDDADDLVTIAGGSPGAAGLPGPAFADVRVLLNDACLGDIDGDGEVGFPDLLVVLADWGACPVGASCRADLDGSGDVGFDDLLILSFRVGPCD